MSESKYIVRQNGVIVGVLCKVCGVPIRGLVPVGEPIDTRKNGSMIIRDNFMMLGVGANYQEVEFEVEKDGRKGKHFTALCRPCAGRLTTENMERIYTEDLDQLESEGQDVKELRKWQPKRAAKVRGVP
jgi:hypothetical protein